MFACIHPLNLSYILENKFEVSQLKGVWSSSSYTLLTYGKSLEFIKKISKNRKYDVLSRINYNHTISWILNTDQSNIWERQRFTGELDRLHKKLER